jgi:hypothetical protein
VPTEAPPRERLVDLVQTGQDRRRRLEPVLDPTSPVPTDVAPDSLDEEATNQLPSCEQHAGRP